MATGQSTTVTVTYHTGAGGTGHVSLTASDISSSATGQLTVILPSAPPVITNDAPSSIAYTAENVTSNYPSFHLKNNGNTAASYTLAASCDQTVISNCTVRSNPGSINSGATATVIVDFQSHAYGTGWLALTATSPYGETTHDTLTMVALSEKVSVSRQLPSITIAQLGGTHAVGFTVSAIGNYTNPVTYTLTTTCSGAVTCPTTPSPSTVTITPGSPKTTSVTATATSNPIGGSGYVKATASFTNEWGQVYSAKDSTLVTVPDQRTYTVAVSPVGQDYSVEQQADTSYRFTVINGGNTAATYSLALTPSCTWVGAACTLRQSSVHVNAGTSAFAYVDFHSGLTSDGTILPPDSLFLTATGPSNSSTGRVHVIPTAPSVAVASPGGADTLSYGDSASATFTINNWGTAGTVSYTVTATCSGSAVTCTVPGGGASTTVSVAQGATVNVPVRYHATSDPTGGAGTVKLRASIALFHTYADSASYLITVPDGRTSGVIVTPDGATEYDEFSVDTNYVFHVQNTGNVQTTYTLSVPTCTGGVSTCVPQPSTITVAPGATGNARVKYHTGAAGGPNGAVTLRASFGGAADSGFVTVVPSSAAVAVSALDGTPTVNGSSSGTYHFQVTNTGNVGAVTYTLEITGCTAPLTACTAPDSVTVTPGTPQTVAVSFQTQSTVGTGTVALRAYLVGGVHTYADTAAASVTVTVPATPGAPDVDVTNTNFGETVTRDRCLTLSLGQGAASECGDLRLVHALPTLRTMNTTRMPVLLYNSQFAAPHPVIQADVTIPAGTAVPNTVRAQLTINGVSPVDSTWPASAWSTPGTTRRVEGDGDAAALTTGVYPYTLTVTNNYSVPTAPIPTSVTGTLIIVNRSTSAFGAGWWLAGLEELHIPAAPADTTILWVGGDGSARVYHKVSATVWKAATVDRPDSLTRRVAGSDTTYTRWGPHQLQVQFDHAGRHVATINRQGHTTTFAYAASLTSITLPPSSAGLTYQFRYDAGGKLDSVSAGSATTRRTTRLYIQQGRIDSIGDPNAKTVGFHYTTGLGPLVTSRTDRRGHTTTYQYDTASNTVSSVSVAMQNPAPAITTTFRDARRVALAAPAIVDSVSTRVNGPRTDTTITTFWLDRFGEPRKIVNAVGDSTVLSRTNATFPALVTSLRRPNGFTTTALYDAHGNPTQLTDINPLNTSSNAVTTVSWDTKWDFATGIDRPGSVPLDTMAYDATTGNRLWQQTGTDVTRRVTFNYYNAFQLFSSSQTPLQAQAGVRDSVMYDALGNVDTTRTPLGIKTGFGHDAFGRTIAVSTPIDAAQTTFRDDSTTYDVMDRAIRQVNYAPPVGTQPTEKAIVVTAYDDEGNVVRVQRTGEPSIAGTTLTDSATYDWANRKVKAIAVDGQVESTVYDPAGNVDTVITRRGHTLTMTYDALNRLTSRITPEVAYQKQTFNTVYYPDKSNDAAGGYTIPRDSAGFTYDVAGNLLRADNGDALIRRSYAPNGTLLTDTLVVRNYTVAGGGGDTTAHRYGLRYSYDLAGRRTALHYPSVLVGTGMRDSIAYTYDDTKIGALATITDPLVHTYQYDYDLDGREWQLTYPGGLTEQQTYDLDDRLIHRTELNKPNHTGQYDYPNDTLRDESFTLDVRGKITQASDPTRLFTGTYVYGSLGELLGYNSSVIDVRGFINGTPLTQQDDDIEAFTVDPMGNIRSMGYSHNLYWTNFQIPDWSEARGLEGYQYQSGTGRLLSTHSVGDPAFFYDLAGNQVRDISDGTTVSWYGADNVLRAVEHRGAGVPGGDWMFDEYRYDALGRRVLVRTRSICLSGDCPNVIRRTIWDGSEEVGEIQGNGGDDILPSGLEEDAPGGAGDSRLLGRVLYVHGLTLDQPLGVIRLGYTAQGFYDGIDSLDLSLHYTWRGTAEFTSFPDGAVDLCPNGRTQGCVESVLAGAAMSAYQRQYIRPTSWYGSLVNDRSDATGLRYLRNRYYDPVSGRFTQEDPLGLAGGLNTYGFANGDPMNYSDPFGLCPDPNKPWCSSPLYSLLRLVGVSDAAADRWAGIAYGGASIAGAPGMGMAVRGAATTFSIAGEAAAQNPLNGTRYSGKVRQQMRQGDNHSFPLEVDNFAKEGNVSSITGGDGVTRTRVGLRGSYKGREGTFEWIVEPDKTINHRQFIPDPR